MASTLEWWFNQGVSGELPYSVGNAGSLVLPGALPSAPFINAPKAFRHVVSPPLIMSHCSIFLMELCMRTMKAVKGRLHWGEMGRQGWTDLLVVKALHFCRVRFSSNFRFIMKLAPTMTSPVTIWGLGLQTSVAKTFIIRTHPHSSQFSSHRAEKEEPRFCSLKHLLEKATQPKSGPSVWDFCLFSSSVSNPMPFWFAWASVYESALTLMWLWLWGFGIIW